MKNNKELIIHTLAGLLIGYFLIHPVSMVIYWFQLNANEYTLTDLFDVFLGNVRHSFSLHMMPMSVAFSILGALMGLGSGFYYKSIKKREYLLYGKKQLLQQSIPSLIANGESEFVEFKSSLRHDYRQIKTDKNLEDVILKSIAGFLNAKGGTLMIGVNDSGEILGLENDYWSLKRKDKDGFQQRLILIISNAFGKDICTKIHIAFHEINAKEICTLYIEPSQHPVFVNEDNRTIFFLRTGNVTNPLTTSEVVKYLQNRKFGY
ncbi:MAG: ATP-binding protein [Prolixibacteraceae bacterium]|nr:ATP-binding protein [Prolixibacteraceae bacterium]